MKIYPLAKRTFDAALAGTALVILSPVIAGIAIAIKAGSNGPLLYRGKRVGLNGEQFEMLKFRTMVVNADQIGGSSRPRTTRV
jgi:Sugar transferases involved in lipopolysaccharide synthesis